MGGLQFGVKNALRVAHEQFVFELEGLVSLSLIRHKAYNAFTGFELVMNLPVDEWVGISFEFGRLDLRFGVS